MAKPKREMDMKVDLTINELRILKKVAEMVHENMEYNKQEGEYQENSDNFILTLDKGDYTTLGRAVKKL